MIYLASPYTSEHRRLQQCRVTATAHIVRHCLDTGKYVYSPILHGHFVEQQCYPADWQKWMSHSFSAITALKRVMVAAMPGWDKSKGVQAEIAFAEKMEFPITVFSLRDMEDILPSKLFAQVCHETGWRG